MMDRLQKFFYGRYGPDSFSLVMLFVSFILLNIRYAWIAGILLTCYVVFRTLSKNTGQRRKELQKFNEITLPVMKLFKPLGMAVVRGVFSLSRKYAAYKYRRGQSKDFVFFRCANCRNMLRLPRNKGKLSVTCPVCKKEYIKKT